MSAHTETPWHADETAIFGADGVIARIPNHPENGKNWKVDAPFIIKAVNRDHHFDALVKALEESHNALRALKISVEVSRTMNGREYIGLGIQVHDALDKAVVVLASLNGDVGSPREGVR